MRVPDALEILNKSETVDFKTLYPYDDRNDLKIEVDTTGIYIPALNISIRKGKEIQGQSIVDVKVIYDGMEDTDFLYYYSGDYLESIQDCLRICGEDALRVEDIKQMKSKFVYVE